MSNSTNLTCHWLRRVALRVGAVAACLALVAGGQFWRQHRSDVLLPVQFAGMTNDPTFGRCALLRAENRTDGLIICQNYGYLSAGESGTFAYPIPPGAGQWCASVLWQDRADRPLNGVMMCFQERVREVAGIQFSHHDPWFPLPRVSHCPDLPR